MIHYLTPYATDKNIGKAINDACSLVPDGDWICLRDGDAMFTTPDYGLLIADVVERHGNEYDLFGAMTNRIGWKHHQVPGMFDDWDYLRHVKAGEVLRDTNGSDVVPTGGMIAGFFMLFSKRTWDRVKFTENREEARLFDGHFSRQVGRRALISGMYLFHAYRPWSDNPRNDIKHLI